MECTQGTACSLRRKADHAHLEETRGRAPGKPDRNRFQLRHDGWRRRDAIPGRARTGRVYLGLTLLACPASGLIAARCAISVVASDGFDRSWKPRRRINASIP